MKNRILYSILSIVVFAACGPSHVVVQQPPVESAPPPQPEPVEVSYQSFYDELSPYGRWIDYPGYGYVWMPSVGYGFKPYSSNGHWIYTDMGWTWASDYPWGWAAFHYGRWFFDGSYGWMWLPGQEWAPAWVSWRSSPDYYGWAPLGPNYGMGGNMGYYNPPANYWCFVPHQYITHPHMNNYYVNESRNVTIINNTTVINNTYYNGNGNGRNIYRSGPNVQEVERYSGSPVRPAVIRESNRPGEQFYNNQYNIYRPRVNTNPTVNPATNRPQRPAPNRVESLRDIHPATANNGNPGNNSPVERGNNGNNGNNNNNPPVYRQNPGQQEPANNGNPNGNRPQPQSDRRQTENTNSRSDADDRMERADHFRNGNPPAKQEQKATVMPGHPAGNSGEQTANRPATNNQPAPVHNGNANHPNNPSQTNRNNRSGQPSNKPVSHNDEKPSQGQASKEKPEHRSAESGRPEDKR